MLVVGTSGLVYPAAELPALAKALGADLIDVNVAAGPISTQADLFLQGASGEVLPALLRAVKTLA
jgi:NAD-dependent deacetylase